MTAIAFTRTTNGEHFYQWFVERAWSCPLHDHDIADDYRWDDCGEEDIPEVCSGCLAGGWKVAYDADGYTTMIAKQVGPWETLMMGMRGPLVESMTRDQAILNGLLTEQLEAAFDGGMVRVPIVRAPQQGSPMIFEGTRLPRSEAAQAALDADQP